VIVFRKILQAILGAVLLACAFVSSPARVRGAKPSRDELLARIQAGDSTAILEAGKSGDQSLIPVLEGFLQARRDTVTETMTKLKQAYAETQNTDEEKRRFLPPREALMTSEYDSVAQNVRMALAKLGVHQYLDEILIELKTPTNSTLHKVCCGSEDGYRVQAGALRKLAYVNNPTTIKDVAEFLKYTKRPNAEWSDYMQAPLAKYATQTLRSMVKNPLPTDDPLAWQQWWEQNKDKYP